MVNLPGHQRHDDARGTSHTASEPRTSYSTFLFVVRAPPLGRFLGAGLGGTLGVETILVLTSIAAVASTVWLLTPAFLRLRTGDLETDEPAES